ncbi:collagen alpha-4(VI) chain-like isoform X2 [Lissotriton helveticus]
MSATVTPELFARMKAMVAALLQDLRISNSNCPVGARVALLAYAHSSSYHVRFQDHHSRRQLLQAVHNLVQARSSQRGRLAAAIRFVSRNVFKRARSTLLGRKVAIFFSSGDSQAVEGVDKALLQMEALGIIPVVVTFQRLPEVENALQANGQSQYIQLSVSDDYQDVEKLHGPVSRCTICFDICQPGDCLNRTVPNPLRLPMDLRLLVDTSFNSPSVSAEMVSRFLGTVLDSLRISPHPKYPGNTTRISFLQTGSQRWAMRLRTLSGEKPLEKGVSEEDLSENDSLEFGFTQHITREDMKHHMHKTLKPWPNILPLTGALEWAVEIGFPHDYPGRLRGLLVVLTGGTSHWEQEKHMALAKLADCKDVILFILLLGERAVAEDMEATLAGMGIAPWKYHMLQLPLTLEPEIEYARRTVLAFFRRVLVETRGKPRTQLNKDCTAGPPLSASTMAPSTPTPAEEVDTHFMQHRSTEPPPENGMASHTDSSGMEAISDAIHLKTEPNIALLQQVEVTPEASTVVPRGVTLEGSTNLSTEPTTSKPPMSSSLALPGHPADAPGAMGDPCLLPKDAGTVCADYSLKWYHEATQGVCVRFWYRGCGGNANRFDTEQECLEGCITTNRRRSDSKDERVVNSDQRRSDSKDERVVNSEVCKEQKDAGPCHSFLAKWFFNSTSLRCERFWYGGCGGNGNRFESWDHCKSTCVILQRSLETLHLHAKAHRDN